MVDEIHQALSRLQAAFVAGFLAQRFERWNAVLRSSDSALQRALVYGFSIKAKAALIKPAEAGYEICTEYQNLGFSKHSELFCEGR